MQQAAELAKLRKEMDDQRAAQEDKNKRAMLKLTSQVRTDLTIINKQMSALKLERDTLRDRVRSLETAI